MADRELMDRVQSPPEGEVLSPEGEAYEPLPEDAHTLLVEQVQQQPLGRQMRIHQLGPGGGAEQEHGASPVVLDLCTRVS